MVLCTQQSQTPQCASQAKLSSVVQYTPRSKVIKIAQKALGCASHRGAESSSAVCFPPWSQAPGCASHRRVKIKIFVSLYVVAFKGTIRRNPFNPIRYCWGPFGPTPTLYHNRPRTAPAQKRAGPTEAEAAGESAGTVVGAAETAPTPTKSNV